MSDVLFDVVMGTFVVLMIWVVWHPRIHTGAVGGLGCFTMCVAALFSMDNSMYDSLEAIESCIIMFAVGATLVLIHVATAVGRATHVLGKRHKLPKSDRPLRRKSDFEHLYVNPDQKDSSGGADGHVH